MDEHLKESLRDTWRALPLVAVALLALMAVYAIGTLVIWGSWPSW